jgi:transmembrane protein 17
MILIFSLTFICRIEVIYKIILLTILLVLSALEIGRLYLGYLGNLTEKVPELSGYWLLTLIQIPLLSFYTFYENLLLLPFERALNFILLAFLLCQLLFGYIANKTLVSHQLNKFYLLQFTEEGDRNPETLQPLQTQTRRVEETGL